MSSSTTRGRRLLFAIFTLSGFSGLIYEAIWSHYLKLFLGHAAYAQTLVLAIFMGGMAFGSWLMARYSQRLTHLLIGYAIVEGAIGVLGLIFHRTSIGITSWAFASVLPEIAAPAAVHLIKWTLGALLILPQSILLGMTFPLMSGATVRRFPERSGETLAMLYFTNSLGAAVGVLVSGFVLIGAVGLPGTIMTAGLMNIALALLVWMLAKRQPEAVPPLSVRAPASDRIVTATILRWMLIGAAVTGAASFLYEIAWIRMLSLVLGSSTHSFEMMLSAFILGIALGGLWVRRRIDSLANPVQFLATIFAIMAVVAILSLPVYNQTFGLMADVVRAFAHNAQGYIGVTVSSHAIAMLVMIPTTFFCGMTLPVMTHVLLRAGEGERAIGAVYAWNTAGAIVGVIVAVHVLMPLIGIKGLVIAGAAMQFALAVLYWTLAERPRTTTALSGTAVGAAVVATAAVVIHLDPLTLSSGVYRYGFAGHDPGTKALFFGHGKTATVSVTEAADGIVSIATNGKPDAAIAMRGQLSGDEITMVLAGALPGMLHPHPRQVAAIGFGSGLTSHVLLGLPTLQSLDTVEIEPLMVKGAQIGFGKAIARAFSDPRSHIRYEDAKTFFAANRRKYDVIVSEPSNPWVSGVATLFSTEFYRQITQFLEPDGMLIQWIQVYETDLDIVVSVIRALDAEFSDFAIYNADNTNILLVAVKRGTVPEPDPRVFASAAVRADLAAVGITTLQDVRSRFLGNRKLLAPLLAASGVPANSDYFPFVDLKAGRARIMGSDARELLGLQVLPVPFFELVSGEVDRRTETLVSPRPTSTRDALTRRAVTVKSAVMSGDYQDLAAGDAALVMVLHSTREACAVPAVQQAWTQSAYFIAAETSTYLSAHELAPLWDTIAKTQCAQLASREDLQFVEFLRAVSQRDVLQTARMGQALFANNYPFSGAESLQFTMLATAASEIGRDRPNAALETLAAHMVGMQLNRSADLATRILSAIGTERLRMSAAAARRNPRHSMQ